MLLTSPEAAPEPPPDPAARGRLRIVVADDAVLLREGLVRLLAEDGHQVVAAVGDGPALVAAVLRHRPRRHRLAKSPPEPVSGRGERRALRRMWTVTFATATPPDAQTGSGGR